MHSAIGTVGKAIMGRAVEGMVQLQKKGSR